MNKEIEFKSANHNDWKVFSVIGRLDTVTAPEAEQAKRAKKNFVLFGASGMIKEVLEASGIDMLVTIYETQEDLP